MHEAVLQPVFALVVSNTIWCMVFDTITQFDFPNIPDNLMSKQPDLIELCKEYLKQKFCRGDYKELVVLTLLYLQDEDTMNNFKRFYRPGAMHKARWMAKLLYAIKMVLLGSIIQRDLPKGQIFARGQLVKLKRFVLFTVFCYVPWWLTSPISSSAPKNDLILIRSLEHYRTQDGTIGKAALINAFKNHLWYLTEELVCLALFSSTVDSTPLSRLKWH